MRRSLLLILLSMFLGSCTSGRWIVSEQYALDENATPSIVDQSDILLIEKEPTPDDPIIIFTAYQITEAEYPLRVKMERTVQEYRPRWGYLLLGAAGATFAFLAANSDAVLPSVTSSQRLALNLTGGILGVLSFMNMEPTGEPIYTGESRLMRNSGIEVLQDSVRSNIEEEDNLTDLIVTYQDEVLFSQAGLNFNNSSLELNLSSFSNTLSGRVNEDSQIAIYLMYGEREYEFFVPVNSFLAPFLNVTDPIVLLRNSPEVSATNIISEVGRGSFLEILDDESEEWYRVQYQNTEAYLLKESGEIEWMTTSDSGPALIFEFAELPFGEVDVENLVPVLKPENTTGKALVISNGIDNRIQTRQYLDRDHQLFTHYMETALQINSESIYSALETGNSEMTEVSRQVSPMNNEGSLIVYLSGIADVRNSDGSPEILLLFEDSEGEVYETKLEDVFTEITRIEPGSLFLFVDLDYISNGNGALNGTSRNENLLNRAANQVINRIPNSAVVFSNRPGQESNIYTGFIDGNKRHHIFNYFWAEAIKGRRTQVSDIVRHLERFVDYNARRLHDSPQEINAFGNLTLDLTD